MLEEGTDMYFSNSLTACARSRHRPTPGDGDLTLVSTRQDPATRIPSRSDVAAAMRSLDRRITACAPEQRGGIVLIVVFNRSGRIDRVHPLNPDTSTRMVECVSVAAQQIEIPASQFDHFSVAYPFRTQLDFE